jgi:hypothetical protein
MQAIPLETLRLGVEASLTVFKAPKRSSKSLDNEGCTAMEMVLLAASHAKYCGKRGRGLNIVSVLNTCIFVLPELSGSCFLSISSTVLGVEGAPDVDPLSESLDALHCNEDEHRPMRISSPKGMVSPLESVLCIQT